MGLNIVGLMVFGLWFGGWMVLDGCLEMMVGVRLLVLIVVFMMFVVLVRVVSGGRMGFEK